MQWFRVKAGRANPADKKESFGSRNYTLTAFVTRGADKEEFGGRGLAC
jgi:hypothetical protein